jgi:PhoPQ-activated pathogenicity-related protein
MNKGCTPGRLRFFFTISLLSVSASSLSAGALENYVSKPDTNYRWSVVTNREIVGFKVTQLRVTSQKWRDTNWTHHVQVVRPETIRHPEIGFLFITGDGDGKSSNDMLRVLAERAGAVAAVVTKVPNQPLYEGKKEDALIAYTFDQYLKSSDETWPLLFPMVKSAVRAMDAVQEFVQQEYKQKIKSWVVSGASKRGWTTWLTGAVDPRVKGVAPMVIDMLNMKAQTAWAEKVYGKQSEQIHDYTDMGLIGRLDDPPMIKLRSWVDPYAYRERYKIPKLILIGTNDRYWTVDSLRHYWNDLPEPKLIYQTPNAGHNLGGGKEATQTLAAFFEMIADGRELPKMQWSFHSSDKPTIDVTVSQPIKEAHLWTADSTDRDLRDDKWSSEDIKPKEGNRAVTASLSTPETGYRAYLAEIVLTSPSGHDYKLSTEARVTPDNIKP